MNSNKKELKKTTEVAPHAAGGLFSFYEFDHFFDEFLTRKWPRLLDWNMASSGLEKGFPKVDILDYEDKIEVQAALPGIDKDDLEVSINHQLLTIRAAKKAEQEQGNKEKGKYFRREIVRDEFQRTLSLPDNVDSEHASASFKEGILKMTIPKTEKNKRKNIEIK